MTINEYVKSLDMCKSDLINNELAYYSDFKFHRYYERYLHTANYIHNLFNNNGFSYCCVKAFRNYSHFNTDLNISVSDNDFTSIISMLESNGWTSRDPWSRFKENISEFGKRKMVYLHGSEYCEIHLYPGLSWHGFLYWPHSEIMKNSLLVEMDGISFVNTNNSADFICNIGHALFERYKFTAGELYFINSIIERMSVDDIEFINKIFVKYGWGVSVSDIQKIIDSLYNNSDRYPVLIPKSFLRISWMSRFKYYLNRFNPFAATLELFFNIIWSGNVYKLYSIIKKSITGKSGIEKKYKDLL